MRNDKVFSRDDVVKLLKPTDGFKEVPFRMGSNKIEFTKDSANNMLFRLDNKEFKLSKEAFIKASRICGVPATYVKKFNDESLHLMNPHFNHWFNTKSDDGKLLIAGDNVVSFIKGSTDYYSRVKVLEIIEDTLAPTSLEKDNLLYDKVHHSFDRGLYYSVVSNQEEAMNVGDVVRGGISVQDHILGEKVFTISGYVYRLVCSNGMISQNILSKWSRRSNSEHLEEWVKNSVTQAQTEITSEFERIKHLQEIPINDHGSVLLRNIFSEFSVSSKLREAITDEIINAGEIKSMYDVFNAITSAANSSEFVDNPNMTQSLQMLASGVAEHSTFCPTCQSLLDVD